MDRIIRLTLVAATLAAMSGCWWRRRVVVVRPGFAAQQEMTSSGINAR